MDATDPERAPRLALRDLRLQWSWAYLSRGKEPEAIARVRRQVRDAIVQVEQQLALAASEPERQVLGSEIKELHELCSQMDRLAPPAAR